MAANCRRLEEVKGIEIEILRNDIKQRDMLLDEAQTDLKNLTSENRRLADRNSFLEKECEGLKKLCSESLESIKEMTQKNIRTYRNQHPLRTICDYQLKDSRKLSK